MKKIMIFLSFIFFCFTFIFFDCENVEAKLSKDDLSCDYGIKCIYNLDKMTVKSSSNGQEIAMASLGVYYQCSDSSKKLSECSSFKSLAHVSMNGSSVTSNHRSIPMPYYDEVFGTVSINDNKANYFTKDNKFYCPDFYYRVGGNPNAGESDDWVDIGYESNTHGRLSDGKTIFKGSECIEQNTKVDDDEFKKLVETANDTSIYEQATGDADKDEREGNDIIDAIVSWGERGNSLRYSSEGVDPCALINGEIQKILHDAFLFISVGGIIILVVMTSISLVKVITASEDDALRNFLKGLWKRIICLIILLILPVLVTFIIQLVNNVAPSLGINSDNPLCNVTESE